MTWNIPHILSTNNGTTSAVDTTGADLFVVSVVHNGFRGAVVVSDSAGNTWTQIAGSGGSFITSDLWYSHNPTTSTTHTFTVANADGFSTVYTISGSNPSGTLVDASNSNGTAPNTTDIDTGSITPVANGCLIIAGCTIGTTATSLSVDSGFTLDEFDDFTQFQFTGSAAAHLIQTAAAAANPNFIRGTASTNTALDTGAIVAFRPAPGGGGASLTGAGATASAGSLSVTVGPFAGAGAVANTTAADAYGGIGVLLSGASAVSAAGALAARIFQFVGAVVIALAGQIGVTIPGVAPAPASRTVTVLAENRVVIVPED